MQLTPVMLQAPAVHPAEGFDGGSELIRAVFFDGLPWKGQPTRVFAWIGIPPVEPGQKVPGMVLVHGGGGAAFAHWVQQWVDRGYAAIAMDTCGSVPIGQYPDWKRHDHSGPPGWGGFDPLDERPEDQWPYHAVADVVLAHSLLRAQAGVDPDRIGLTGISWGGYLTCLVAGLDNRFAFAAPVYGCGFLGENSGFASAIQGAGDRGREWLARWDPSAYLGSARMPLLWVTGTNDFAFPLDSLQKSYQLAPARSTLCVRLRMPHSHPDGEAPAEIPAFADHLLRDGPALVSVTEPGEENSGQVWAGFDGPTPVRAELLATADAGPWTDRQWNAHPAQVDAPTRRVTAALPEGTTVWFLNLIDEEGRVVSSPHVVVEPEPVVERRPGHPGSAQ